MEMENRNLLIKLLLWSALILWFTFFGMVLKQHLPYFAAFVFSGTGGTILALITFGSGMIHGPDFIRERTENVYNFLRRSLNEMKIYEIVSFNALGLLLWMNNFGEIKKFFKEIYYNEGQR